MKKIESLRLPGPRGGPKARADRDARVEAQHSFRGSFSAVSTPIFATKYSFCSIFQELQDLFTCAPLRIQDVTKMFDSLDRTSPSPIATVARSRPAAPRLRGPRELLLQVFGKISATCCSFSTVAAPIFASIRVFQHFLRSTRLPRLRTRRN